MNATDALANSRERLIAALLDALQQARIAGNLDAMPDTSAALVASIHAHTTRGPTP